MSGKRRRPMDDPWEEPTAKAWVRHVLDDMAHRMADSAIVISLVPEDRGGDVKFWVELGASIMMDKPILAAVGDAPIPAKLLAVADEVVRLPDGVNPAASEAIKAAIERMMS